MVNYINELKTAFSYTHRESKNLRVGPCPECQSRRTLSVAVFPGKVVLGTFHCWSCGYSGRWNTLAERMHMKKKKEDITETSAAMLTQVRMDAIKPPRVTKKKWHGEWRGIPESVLLSLGAKLWLDITNYSRGGFRVSKRLYLPVSVNGDEVGYVGALIDRKEMDEDNPKYKNSLGAWAKEALYPLDFVCPTKVAILVEGPYDALHLLGHGLPGLCTFGVENWAYPKTSLLISNGVETVIPLLDNDKAGRRCLIHVVKDCSKAGLNVELFDYKSKDPGEMTDSEISKLKSFVASIQGE